MLRSLVLLLLATTLTACVDKEEITLAVAEDNYVSGVLRDQSFRYAADSRSAGLLLNGEDHTVDVDTLIGLTKTTIVRGEAGRERGVCITFSVPNDKNFGFPYRADRVATCFADFMRLDAVNNVMVLDERVPVTLNIEQWTADGDLRGTFTGVGTELAGEFRIQLRLP